MVGNVNCSRKYKILTNAYLKADTVQGKAPVLELISEPVLELKTTMRNLLIVTRYEKVHNGCN